MSDYLSRVLERESSAAPAVRPALPSIFDPGPASPLFAPLEMESSGDGDPSHNTGHETGAEIVSRPPPVTAAGTLRTEAVVPLGPPRKSKVAPGETFVRPVDAPVAPVVPAFPPELPLPRQPLPGAAAAQSVVRPGAETPPRPARAVAVKPIVRPAIDSAPDAPGAALAAGENRPSAASARSAREMPEPEPGMQPTPPDAVSPALATISRLFPAPASARRARNTPAGHDAAASRPVHITIGRIEVRAVHSPPEPIPQRPAPAPAKISLDDYLRRQRGNAA